MNDQNEWNAQEKHFTHNQPALGQRARQLQQFGEITKHLRIGLSDEVRKSSIDELNQVLADSLMLRDLYKKHHWQVSGVTFSQLHLLFDKHYEEQVVIVDALAERIQILGGVSLALPQDVAEATRIARPPKGREEVPVQISRLLEAHETILVEARDFAGRAATRGDDGTNDLLVGSIRTNEMQTWFLSEHLIKEPLTQAV